MDYLTSLLDFSRSNCAGICAFLVPANLVATSTTLVLLFLQRPQIRWTTVAGSFAAITLFLHVATWLIIGVVSPVTFLLSGLASTCLVINLLANRFFTNRYQQG